MHANRRARLRATVLSVVCALASLFAVHAEPVTCTGCVKPSFAAPQSAGDDLVERGFAVADFDQDGKLDVALPTRAQDAQARIYFGTGRAALDPDPLLLGPPFGYTTQAVTADLNSDGLPDLLLLNDAGTLWVYLGDGAGGFVPEGLGGLGHVVAVGDFDGDGHPDLVTPITAASGVVRLYAGRGDGTFEAPTSTAVGSFPVSLVVANIDGGPTTDLAVLNQGDQTISILLGDGAGHLTPAGTVPFSGSGFAIAAGDLDGDGHVDLAVGGSGFSTQGFVSTFIGDGTGVFVPGTTIDGDVQVQAILLADLTGDGDLDLVADRFDGLTVYPGLPGTGFGPGVSYGFPGLYPATGDFDRDGQLDIVLARRGVFVLRNDGSGGLIAPPTWPTPYPSDAMLAKLDPDANLDLIVAAWQNGPPGIVTYLGNGDGTFGAGQTTDVTFQPEGLSVGQFTNDTHLDVAGSNGFQVFFLPGNGAGGFGPAAYFDAGTFPRATAAADFDGDGKLDIVAVGWTTEILFGDGTGGFSALTSVGPGSDFVRVADLDGVNGPDIILAGSSNITVFLNDGSGGFGPPATYGGSGRIALGDFDEDGKLDAIGVDLQMGLVFVRGNGAGGFEAPVAIFPQGSYFIDAADFNGDGHLDLMLDGDTFIRVAIGAGDGTFASPTQWATPLGVVVAQIPGDLDDDGRPDLVAVGHEATVLLNTNCKPRRLGVSTDVATCAPPGQILPQQPVVGVYDDGGNVVACDTGLVTAAIVAGTGAPGAALGGTTSRNAVAGVATFTDLSVDLAGTGYELELSHASVPKTRTRAFRVGDPPAAPSASNSGPFCQGQDLALYATTVPGAVYRWTGPNGFSSTAQSPVIHAATLDAAGDYSVVAVVEGCASSAAITTVAALTPAPGPAILGETAVCFGSRLLLHADDGALRHQWYRNGKPIDGATSPLYTVAQAGYADAGSYAVTATDATGCTTALSAPVPVAVVFCYAEAKALAIDPGGNGVLDPGETAIVDPTWENRDIEPLSLTGTAPSFTGPGGPTYTIADATAGYGSIDPNASADCLTATGDCYGVSVAGPRPATHWDAFLDEVPGIDPAHTWLLHVGGSFGDVPSSHPFYAAIETVLHNRVTAGCASGASYCPSSGVTRAQMAVFLLKGRYGADFVPPACHGQFADVPCPSAFADWIEELASLGITAGCGGGNYCPNAVVTRAQMAVFLLKARYIGPPPCTGVFADVSCPGGFGVDYIEELYHEGITGGCGASPLIFCPANPNTRGQMAVFLTRSFSLVLYGP
jgi:hypothetical protein